MEDTMSEVKPIRSNEDHEAALALLNRLIDENPAIGSDDDAKINVLTALIEDYESSILPDYQTDPIESIKFRIEQLGIKDKDLAAYLGSPSRVSEVLAGKRPLTVTMIKNLEDGLGIPASILIGSSAEKKNKRWTPKTMLLMAKRGYFGPDNTDIELSEIVERGLLRSIFNPTLNTATALLRQSNYRDISNVDKFHLDAWSNKVVNEALSVIHTQNVEKYEKSKVNKDVFSELFKLSSRTDGVHKVLESLKELGIVVIIEPQLPNTKLDGATFFVSNTPIIGLTLRIDRLDNFWFTLSHELSHILLHVDTEDSAYFDNLFNNVEELSEIEDAADKLAGDMLIPLKEWQASPLKYASTPTLVRMFAEKIGVHETVVAGRIRHESKDWVSLSDVVHDHKVRHLFGGIQW